MNIVQQVVIGVLIIIVVLIMWVAFKQGWSTGQKHLAPNNTKVVPSGMTELNLRDYFAAQAMQGFNRGMVDYGWAEEVLVGHAKSAYAIADAMLKEREKS